MVAARGGGEVRVDTALGPAPASGDPRLAESLVTNLVDNALRYNEPGGWVSVETGADGGHSVLRVRNSGLVVPRSSVAALLEPFRRLDGASRGRTTIVIAHRLSTLDAFDRLLYRGQTLGHLSLSQSCPVGQVVDD